MSSGPHLPDVAAWIARLKPEDEYALRLALCEVFDSCRTDRAWQHRLFELNALLVEHPGDMSRFRERAQRLAARIRLQADQAPTPDPAAHLPHADE